MPVVTAMLSCRTRGNGDTVDLTMELAEAVKESGLLDGVATLFIGGSTAGITTIEFEPGLIQDFPAAMERFAPRNIRYEHDETWHDGNGHSHVRASTIGPSLGVPIAAGFIVGDAIVGVINAITKVAEAV